MEEATITGVVSKDWPPSESFDILMDDVERQAGLALPVQGEDTRFVIGSGQSEPRNVAGSPAFVNQLASLCNANDVQIKSFYQRWGPVTIDRTGRTYESDSRYPDWYDGMTEPLWMAKRESYRLLVLLTFIEAIRRAIRNEDGVGSDSLLRCLFFTGYINHLSSRSHDVRQWLKPILDTGVYQGGLQELVFI